LTAEATITTKGERKGGRHTLEGRLYRLNINSAFFTNKIFFGMVVGMYGRYF